MIIYPFFRANGRIVSSQFLEELWLPRCPWEERDWLIHISLWETYDL